MLRSPAASPPTNMLTPTFENTAPSPNLLMIMITAPPPSGTGQTFLRASSTNPAGEREALSVNFPQYCRPPYVDTYKFTVPNFPQQVGPLSLPANPYYNTTLQ